jgi:hypothetical protein
MNITITIVLYFLLVVITFYKSSYKTSVYNFIVVTGALVFYLIFYTTKSPIYANDYIAYYNWFYNVASFDRLSDVLNYRGEFLISLYFYIFSFFGNGYLTFDLSMVFLFSVCLGSCYQYFKCKYSFGLFLILIVFSRLFLDYSGNTLRSFVSVFLLLPFIFYIDKFFQVKRSLFLILVSFYIHLKLTVFVLTIRSISIIFRIKISDNYVRFIVLFITLLFATKFLLDFKFHTAIDFMTNQLSFYQDSTQFQLRTEKVDILNQLSLSLFVQIIMYIFYPIILFSYFNNDGNKSSLNFFIVLGLLLVTVFYPEFVLVERLCQVLFVVGIIQISKLRLKFYYYLPIIFMNVVTLINIGYMPGF